MSKGWIIICLVLALGAAGYYFWAQQNAKDSEITGIQKDWWDDPNSAEAKWASQFDSKPPLPEEKKKEIPWEEQISDHYEDMRNLQKSQIERAPKMVRKIGRLKEQLKTVKDPFERRDIEIKIEKRVRRLQEMKEDDEFMRLLMGTDGQPEKTK